MTCNAKVAVGIVEGAEGRSHIGHRSVLSSETSATRVFFSVIIMTHGGAGDQSTNTTGEKTKKMPQDRLIVDFDASIQTLYDMPQDDLDAALPDCFLKLTSCSLWFRTRR